MNKRLYKKIKEFKKMEYYYYTLTSNSKYKINKRKVKEIPEKLDISNLTTKNYFFTKAAAEIAANEFINLLQGCFKRGKLRNEG